MDVETTVKEFIEMNFLYRNVAKNVSTDESLLHGGLLDSMGIFQLVAFIEGEFNIDVLDEEIIPENFETLNNMAAFIKAKQKG